MRIALLAIIAVCFAGGCKSTRHEPEKSPAFAAFEKRLDENGAVTFRSWNGQAYRMDSDTELAFFPDRTVQMLEHRMGVTHFSGSYHLEPDGHLTATFHDYQPLWPTTLLAVDGDSLLLQPIEEEGFIVGTRGGPTAPKNANGFWPFRMLSGDEEHQVLEAMKRDFHEKP